MKIETIMDAMLTVHREMLFEFGKYASAQEIKESKRYRQLHAFRDRILRMDKVHRHVIANLDKMIISQRQFIDKKDQRIAELEGYNADQNTIINKQHQRIAALKAVGYEGAE